MMSRGFAPLGLLSLAAVGLSLAGPSAPDDRAAGHPPASPVPATGAEPPDVAPASAFRGFGTPAFYRIGPLGIGPEGFRTGDLTGDGYADIAIANSQRDDVAILINNGDATFTLGAPVPTPILPFDVTIADFNGDGLGDLAVAFFGTTPTDPPHNGGVGVYLATAPGVFGPGVFYAAGADPHNVDVGDLDGDGDIDVVAFAQTSSEFAVLLNQGDGTFTGPGLYPTGRVPQDGALGDLDGDGDLDAVGGSAFGLPGGIEGFAVHLNKGDGTFEDMILIRTAAGIPRFALGDMNDDGRVDVVVQNAPHSLSIFESIDGRTFVERGPFSTGRRLRDQKQTARITNDTATDVSPIFGIPPQGFLRGDGMGNLLQPVINFSDETGQALRFADLDNDGDQDLISGVNRILPGPVGVVGILVELNLNVDLPSIDLSGDGVINALEIALVLTAWGDAGGPADLNHDGTVNGADLAVVLNLFGQTVPGRVPPDGASPIPTIGEHP